MSLLLILEIRAQNLASTKSFLFTTLCIWPCHHLSPFFLGIQIQLRVESLSTKLTDTLKLKENLSDNIILLLQKVSATMHQFFYPDTQLYLEKQEN
jgi:hypothetical protein